MTELQQKEFGMLRIFIDICDKLNLKYYLVCGSCLGAVKYNGFIPWDDDLDVGLLREDYEVFIDKAQNYLPDQYFLQNYRTDKYSPFLMSKLRNCNTTCIEETIQKVSMNHGIFIDIFPLDGYPTDVFEAERFEKKKRAFERKSFVRAVCSKFDFSRLHRIRTYFNWLLFTVFDWCGNTSKIVEKYDELVASYSVDTSDFICNHGNWQGRLEYASKEQYGHGTWATFEGLKVRIPENYDAYLTQKYGDWRTDPPFEKQNSGHHFLVCDTTRPYTDYIVRLKNGKIRLKTSNELQRDGITPPESCKY